MKKSSIILSFLSSLALLFFILTSAGEFQYNALLSAPVSIGNDLDQQSVSVEIDPALVQADPDGFPEKMDSVYGNEIPYVIRVNSVAENFRPAVAYGFSPMWKETSFFTSRSGGPLLFSGDHVYSTLKTGGQGIALLNPVYRSDGMTEIALGSLDTLNLEKADSVYVYLTGNYSSEKVDELIRPLRDWLLGSPVPIAWSRESAVIPFPMQILLLYCVGFVMMFWCMVRTDRKSILYLKIQGTAPLKIFRMLFLGTYIGNAAAFLLPVLLFRLFSPWCGWFSEEVWRLTGKETAIAAGFLLLSMVLSLGLISQVRTAGNRKSSLGRAGWSGAAAVLLAASCLFIGPAGSAGASAVHNAGSLLLLTQHAEQYENYVYEAAMKGNISALSQQNTEVLKQWCFQGGGLFLDFSMTERRWTDDYSGDPGAYVPLVYVSRSYLEDLKQGSDWESELEKIPEGKPVLLVPESLRNRPVPAYASACQTIEEVIPVADPGWLFNHFPVASSDEPLALRNPMIAVLTEYNGPVSGSMYLTAQKTPEQKAAFEAFLEETGLRDTYDFANTEGKLKESLEYVGEELMTHLLLLLVYGVLLLVFLYNFLVSWHESRRNECSVDIMLGCSLWSVLRFPVLLSAAGALTGVVYGITVSGMSWNTGLYTVLAAGSLCALYAWLTLKHRNRQMVLESLRGGL